MAEILTIIMNLSVLVFVLSSMLAMGLNLTIQQIIAPLRNIRLVILALVANFILVPALAYLILLVIPLSDGLATGLILIATAAGAPFIPKLAQAARGNLAFSVGLMVLLMVVTIIYMPIVLPFLLQGVSINPWEIAQSLIILMLIPLAVGLYIKSRLPETAQKWQPRLSQLSTYAIGLLMVTGLLVNIKAIIGVIGTGGLLAVILFLLVSLLLGYILGGSDGKIRSVLGLGTAQRNLSAALVVAAGNFAGDPDVIVMILAAGLVGLVLLMLAAGELGKRTASQ